MKSTMSKADLIGLGIGFLLLGLVGTVFAQGLFQSREGSNRAVCAANLRGISQSMNIYGADNSDVYPLLVLPDFATSYDVAIKEETGPKSADAALESLYVEKKYRNNPSAGLWIMVLTGQVAPKQFICKSDPFAGQPSTTASAAGEYYLNFQSPKGISYSSLFPWAEKDKKVILSPAWKSNTDEHLVILSDMAPYLGRKAKPEELATRPAEAPASQNATASAPASAPSVEWSVTKANSQNHLFEGQNIAFGDGHAEFVKKPDVGHSNKKMNDSIWGIEKDVNFAEDHKIDEVPIEAGTLTHAPTGMQDFWDVVMVPTRDAKGNLK